MLSELPGYPEHRDRLRPVVSAGRFLSLVVNALRDCAAPCRVGAGALLALGSIAFSSTVYAAATGAHIPDCKFDDVIGTSRVLEVDTDAGPRFGALQYRETVALKAREVVLTFDDGPSRAATDEILDVLARHCVRATFFQVGIWARHRRQIARRVADEGHTLGSHTWSHPKDFKLMSFADARAEVERGFEGVSRAIGRPIARFLRYPGLNDSAALNAYAARRGYAVFSCDVATDDWRGIDAEAIVERTLDNLRRAGNRGIILFHDTKLPTARALPLLLARLKADGFRVVHLTAVRPYRAGERQRLADAARQ